MIFFPHSKVNIGLNILRKRADGYHDLETLFYPIPLKDGLEIIENKDAHNHEFTSTGLEIKGNQEDNLVLKAVQLLEKDFEIPPLKIHLHKVIPMGAGLGGGSSDGAFALRLLNEMFDLKLSIDQLKKYASLLGSDCAFFIEDTPKIALGRGEILSSVDLDLSNLWCVLIKPNCFVSTAEAYANVIPCDKTTSLSALNRTDMIEWKDYVKNDFENSVFTLYPEVKDIKSMLYQKGAIFASMSGSGSSVFGLFEKKPNIEIQSDSFYWCDKL